MFRPWSFFCPPLSFKLHSLSFCPITEKRLSLCRIEIKTCIVVQGPLQSTGLIFPNSRSPLRGSYKQIRHTDRDTFPVIQISKNTN